MKIALGRLAAAVTITFVAGCGNSSSGGNTSSPEALCQGICGNEAKLACPNGNEANCNTGCQTLLAQTKAGAPNCVDQINAMYACTGKVATTSIHCSANSSAPDYDPGFCAAESAALTSCLGECNTVGNTATTIDETQVAGALPTAEAAGGSFAPGTYFRTAATVYTGSGGATGPNGVTDKQTIVLSNASAGGGAFVAQSVQSTNGGADQRGTLMGTPSGTTVSLLITCPASGPFGAFPYTATATSFTLYNTLHNVVEVYTKQ
jgi:hypothetical protein